MYQLVYTNQFRRSLRKCSKRGLDIGLLKRVIDILQEKGTLPGEYNAHKLVGTYAGLWECHIKPNWLLVWKQDDNRLILIMTDTGTHADLFG